MSTFKAKSTLCWPVSHFFLKIEYTGKRSIFSDLNVINQVWLLLKRRKTEQYYKIIPRLPLFFYFDYFKTLCIRGLCYFYYLPIFHSHEIIFKWCINKESYKCPVFHAFNKNKLGEGGGAVEFCILINKPFCFLYSVYPFVY